MLLKLCLRKQQHHVLMQKKALSHASHSLRTRLKPALLEHLGPRFCLKIRPYYYPLINCFLYAWPSHTSPHTLLTRNWPSLSSGSLLSICYHTEILVRKLLLLGSKHVWFLLRPLLQCNYILWALQTEVSFQVEGIRLYRKPVKWMHCESESQSSLWALWMHSR